MSFPLAGIRVLDLGHAVVGPWSTMLLGALGAEVIKVERPDGDLSRGAPPQQMGMSVLYIHANLNKQATIFDLRKPEDRAPVLKLAASADVIVENLRPGAIDRLGLGYDAVAQLNPRVICCSSSAWGTEGPMAGIGGIDSSVQAFSGLASLTGRPEDERPELFRYFAQLDIVASSYIVAAVLEALIARQRTGQGLRVRLSMLGAALQLQSTRIAEYWATSRPSQKLGNASASTAPHQAFACQDGKYLAIGVEHNAQWRRLCGAIGAADLLADKRFAANADRVLHRDVLAAILCQRFTQKPLRYWIAKLEEAGVPCGPFLEFEHLRNHAQALENQYIVSLDTAYGRMCAGGPPWQFSETPAMMAFGGVPGQHTEEVRLRASEQPLPSPLKVKPRESRRLGAALEGIKVLELAQGISGPYTGMLLADAGAEVLKIEPPGGDFYRKAAPGTTPDQSAGFGMINRGKKSVVLDLSHLEARRRLEKLVAGCDVVLEDAPSHRAGAPYLGFEAARAIRGDMVYAAFSGFGEQGPLARKPASELVAQAAAECWASLGKIGEAPERLGADIASIVTGVFGYQGVTAALLHRLRTGRGQQVSVSLFGSLLHLRGVMWAAMTNPDAWFGLHCDSFTKDRETGWKTKDGVIYFDLRRGTDEDFENLLANLGMEAVLNDPRFAHGGREAVGLGRYAQEVKPLWEAAFATRTTAELMALFSRYNGEVIPFNAYDTLFQHPQVRALDIIHEVEGPDGRMIPVIKVPWGFSHAQCPPRWPAPGLGQHNAVE